LGNTLTQYNPPRFFQQTRGKLMILVLKLTI